jgi:hypothetical protein
MDYQDYINALNEAKNSNQESLNTREFKNQLKEQKDAVIDGVKTAVEAPIQLVATELIVKQIAKKLGVSEDAAKSLVKGDARGALKKMVTEKVEQTTEDVSNKVDDATNTVKNTVSDAKNAVSDAKNAVSDTVNDIKPISNEVEDLGGDLWGDEPETNTLSSLFGGSSQEPNPFSFKPSTGIKSLGDGLEDGEDVFNAFDNASSSLITKTAETVASRDAELLSNFNFKTPANKLSELKDLTKTQRQASQEFDRVNNMDSSEEDILNATEKLGKASNDVFDKQTEIEDLRDQARNLYKQRLNDKYNLDDADKLLEDEPLSSDAVESTVESTAENAVSRLGTSAVENESAPGFRLLADINKQRQNVSNAVEQTEQMSNDAVSDTVNAVKNTAVDATEDLGNTVSKVGNLANDAEKASQTANKVAKAGEETDTVLNDVGKVAKVGEVLDEESLADDWNPVGIGITLALTAGTVLAEIFGKKKEHNSPLPQESYSYQAGI